MLKSEGFGDAGDRVSCVARLQFRVVSSGGIEEALSGGWSHRRGMEALRPRREKFAIYC